MGGGAITDGTVEWELIKDGDMPSNIYISFPSTDSYDYEIPVDGYIYGRVYRNSDGDSGNSMLGGNFLKTGMSVGVGRIDIQRYYDNTFIRYANVGDIFRVNRSGSAIYDYRFYYSVNSAKELGLI